jgi:hypothetical protein
MDGAATGCVGSSAARPRDARKNTTFVEEDDSRHQTVTEIRHSARDGEFTWPVVILADDRMLAVDMGARRASAGLRQRRRSDDNE